MAANQLRNIRDTVAAYEADNGRIPDGETVRMNHAKCPAGEDTKERLYLTRKDSGLVLAYCHNCGAGGVATRGKTAPMRGVTASAHTGVPDDVGFMMPPTYRPPNLITGIVDIERPGGEWLVRAHIDRSAAAALELGWDHSTNRLLMPIYERFEPTPTGGEWDGALIGYQARSFTDGAPRYLTTTRNGAALETVFMPFPMRDTHPPLVIVEDLLSAYRVHKETGFAVVPLFRSRTNAEHLARVVRALCPGAAVRRACAYVWLDNDGHAVNDHAEALVRLLKALGFRSVQRISEYGNPKAISGLAIKTALGDF